MHLLNLLFIIGILIHCFSSSDLEIHTINDIKRSSSSEYLAVGLGLSENYPNTRAIAYAGVNDDK